MTDVVGIRVWVTGGRTFGVNDHRPWPTFAERRQAKLERAALFLAMRELHASRHIVRVGHGAAKGADFLAGWWARMNSILVDEFPADWKTHGRKAGVIRNQQGLDTFRPDIVLAAPGGAGTEDCKRRARKAGIEIVEVKL